MKIAILGSGGREHALANQIKKSNKTEKIFAYLEMLVLKQLEKI